MPGKRRVYSFPQKVVFAFMEREVEQYAKQHNCIKLAQIESVTKVYNIYETVHLKENVCLCPAPLGGSAAVLMLEKLIAGGVRSVLAVGCCGALIQDREGDFLLPTKALRQEGVSYQYLPPSRFVEIDPQMIVELSATLDRFGVPYRHCITWTTDAFYRETKDMIAYRKNEGCSVVEMECASLAACSKLRNVKFAQLLFTADTLADIEKHHQRNWGNDTFMPALCLAIKVMEDLKME